MFVKFRMLPFMRSILFTLIQQTLGSGSPDVTHVMLKYSPSITKFEELIILSTAVESRGGMEKKKSERRCNFDGF